MIHHRAIVDDGQTYHWVSLDGDRWLPVNRPPGPDDTPDTVRALFEGDGNFRPMTFGTSILDAIAAANPQPPAGSDG